MKVLLSPAKSLDFEKEVPTQEYSTALFLKQSEKINKILRKKKPKDLSELMDISDKLAQLNWERNQQWQVPFLEEASKSAIYAFNGDVYEGFDAYGLPLEKIEAMQNTIRILSGLYGVLKPLDLILPYRLEMGTSLPIGTHKNLYAFWKETVTKYLNAELQSDEVLVNLASKEYADVVDFKQIKTTLVVPEFKDYKNGQLKIISFFAKKARGLMARYIIDTNANSIEDLKRFNYGGYVWDESLSKGKNLVFTR